MCRMHASMPACLLRKQTRFYITSVHSCALWPTQASSPALRPHVLTEVLLREFQVQHIWFRRWMSIQPGRSLSAGSQGAPADWGLGVGASRVWRWAWEEEAGLAMGESQGSPQMERWLRTHGLWEEGGFASSSHWASEGSGHPDWGLGPWHQLWFQR